MAKPFIIWLKKTEIEVMISTLNKAQLTRHTDELLSGNSDLLNFAQELLTQNKTLVELIDKIQSLNPLQKRVVNMYGTTLKCTHFKRQLQQMRAHCSIYNNKESKKFEKFATTLCTNCPRNEFCESDIN